eukprot:TRINITY_DN2018_c0_g1_i1.p1 TRINITY_DN2018_c0_g1~~TRINITY_DN2018_c0_g1_i1.p1  ORF type:complete len:155 (+),score=26.74 TRINITY_DN2018_c0_g1_i1:50-466(+)
MAEICDADRVALAVANSGVGCWWWHTQTGEIGWNSHMYTIFDKEHSSGPINYAADVTTRLHPDDFAHICRLATHSVTSSTRFKACFRIQRRDGSVTSIMANGDFVDGSGKMTGICIDVTNLDVKTSHGRSTPPASRCI